MDPDDSPLRSPLVVPRTHSSIPYSEPVSLARRLAKPESPRRQAPPMPLERDRHANRKQALRRDPFGPLASPELPSPLPCCKPSAPEHLPARCESADVPHSPKQHLLVAACLCDAGKIDIGGSCFQGDPRIEGWMDRWINGHIDGPIDS